MSDAHAYVGCARSARTGHKDGDGDGWERIDFVVDGKVREECDGAAIRARAIAEDSDASELFFGELGTSWLKDTGISLSSLARLFTTRG